MTHRIECGLLPAHVGKRVDHGERSSRRRPRGMGTHRLMQRPRTASSGSQAPGARPNILLITTDQQHHRLAGYAGDRYLRTPALDRLAREGTRFDLTYAANPVCVPSRYSLLTGYLPHRFDGLETNHQSIAKSLPAIADWVSTPPMGRCLRAAGYDTVYGGKLHVEGISAFTPEAEQRFGFHCLTGDSREELALRSRDFLLARGREPARARRPFFLWSSFINPHDICRVLPRDTDRTSFEPATLEECPPLPENFAPTRAEPRWISRFRDGTLGDESTAELGLNRRFGRSARSWSEQQWRLYRGLYRHFMADVDRQIGIVLDALRRSGLERDTVVIFTSDHDDHDGEPRLTMKRSFFEAAVHVPLLVRWPGRVPAGRVDDVHLINNGIDLPPRRSQRRHLPRRPLRRYVVLRSAHVDHDNRDLAPLRIRKGPFETQAQFIGTRGRRAGRWWGLFLAAEPQHQVDTVPARCRCTRVLRDELIPCGAP